MILFSCGHTWNDGTLIFAFAPRIHGPYVDLQILGFVCADRFVPGVGRQSESPLASLGQPDISPVSPTG